MIIFRLFKNKLLKLFPKKNPKIFHKNPKKIIICMQKFLDEKFFKKLFRTDEKSSPAKIIKKNIYLWNKKNIIILKNNNFI